MEHLSLVPNLNLRRLIKDLLNEGGEGLYVQNVDVDDHGPEGGHRKKRGGSRRSSGEGRAEGDDSGATGTDSSGHYTGREYKFALVAEHILVLKVCPCPVYREMNACVFLYFGNESFVGGKFCSSVCFLLVLNASIDFSDGFFYFFLFFSRDSSVGDDTILTICCLTLDMSLCRQTVVSSTAG